MGMTEQKKLIDALEYCKNREANDSCQCCPYSSDKCAIDDVIMMLNGIDEDDKESVPVLSMSGLWYECPACHRHLIKYADIYCGRCGRVVKWDG